MLEGRKLRRAREQDYAEALKALLLLVPPGKAISYKELARALGVSPRYVGRLLSRNEELVAIPCHRVVREDGRVGGYRLRSGMKLRLLRLEGAVRGSKVPRENMVSISAPASSL
ncbi:MAG: MGMT family protein [Acidilobaceae archaeon]|nr:MGMT family protein [Acidilobaceae archaeon]